jgi:hypothetical protein
VPERRALRPDEEIARKTIIHELGQDVEQHDDGSQQGMYDLRVGSADNPTIVIEVTAARDKTSSQIENTVAPSVPLEPHAGSWLVELRNGQQPRDVPTAAQEIVRLARQASVTEWEADRTTAGFGVSAKTVAARGLLSQRMRTLGVARICDLTDWCRRMIEAGVSGIEVPTRDEAQIVEELPPDDTTIMSADEFVEWIEQFVDARPDLRKKTGGDSAHERHLYIHVYSHQGSARVAALLAIGLGDRIVGTDHITSGPGPERIRPYTHIWIADRYGGPGIRWDGHRWHHFTATAELN